MDRKLSCPKLLARWFKSQRTLKPEWWWICCFPCYIALVNLAQLSLQNRNKHENLYNVRNVDLHCSLGSMPLLLAIQTNPGGKGAVVDAFRLQWVCIQAHAVASLLLRTRSQLPWQTVGRRRPSSWVGPLCGRAENRLCVLLWCRVPNPAVQASWITVLGAAVVWWLLQSWSSMTRDLSGSATVNEEPH